MTAKVELPDRELYFKDYRLTHQNGLKGVGFGAGNIL